MEVDSVRAPVSAANFLKYVEGGFYDGGSVNRAVRPDNTVRQGLRHVDGVVSMARSGPDTATASFSIVVSQLRRRYKLGELQIRRHRREAEEKLGAKCPCRQQRMAQFIAGGGVNPSATSKR